MKENQSKNNDIRIFRNHSNLSNIKSDILMSILASLGDGLSIQDRELRIQYQNQFLTDNFGSHIGEFCYKIYEKRNAPCPGCPIQEAFKTGKTCKALRVGQTKDGEYFHFENIATVLKNDLGEITAGIEVVSLVEERERTFGKLKESQSKLRQLCSHLSQSNNMKELLLDIITHDIKDPVGTIIGTIELINEENISSDLFEIIQKSSENLLKIISHATTLSQVAMNEDLVTEEINLYKTIEKMINNFKPAIASYNMTVVNMIPYGQLIRANPIIEEVFANYISNAIKYAAFGKKLSIEYKEKERFSEIYFKDFGNTIPPEKREDVFIRNLQLEETKGSGLGLSIVKKIAEAHQGLAWVEANIPKGNTFAIKLPIK